ncbi:MAG: hypothetical protein JRJ87_01955 [Deltaproteobacteria bacterium]|nr:hypothetical protein [Deltaproteobacteria bacterium]
MSIGFFTEGIKFDLPHPPINDRTIILVCKVFRNAWQLLINHPPSGFNLKKAKEDTITENLVEIIESRLRKNGEIEGFNKIFFGKVIREPKITNFNKKHPDKMPDIFFDLKREDLPVLSEQDGLFVECKPVDTKHAVYSCYCKKGLIRFVRGDYAWAMQQALMVGYVEKSYSFGKLASVLGNVKYDSYFNTKSHYQVGVHTLYQSVHKRIFKYLGSHGTACPITVSHLWLAV